MYRVLLVDDISLIAEALCHSLRAMHGMDVTRVAVQRDAIQDAACQYRMDAVLVNLSMRGTSGLGLLRDLVGKHREMPVISYSFEEKEEYIAERALSAGAMGYVSGSGTLSDIPEAIATAIRGGRFISNVLQNRLYHRWEVIVLASIRDPILKLSERENEVLRLTGEGFAPKEISARLNISVKTVATYRDRLRTKLKCRDANELFRCAIQYLREQQYCQIERRIAPLAVRLSPHVG